jgi:predicted nucleic acid-binding protein
MIETVPGRVFLDAAYAIALVNKDDALHEIAVALGQDLRQAHTSLVTTRAVLLEIGDSLSKPRYRSVACGLLAAVGRDPLVQVIEVTEALYTEALELYGERPDKGWGLTDCLSFCVMRSQGIANALTHDVHFEQAGFHALMRETAS